MENSDKTPAPAPSRASFASFSWREFSEDFWIRYTRQILIAVIVIAVAAAAWLGWSHLREKAREQDNRKLGSIYMLLHQDPAAAEGALVGFLAADPSGLARDKAALLLGKLYYSQQRYDEALEAYGKVEEGGKSVALLHAGALHGRAAAHMQKAEYAQAAALLDELVSEYGARTGDPEENLVGSEVADFAPNVPNALWKLALCRRALGETEAAQAAAERLMRAYPGSREALDAEKLLTTLD